MGVLAALVALLVVAVAGVAVVLATGGAKSKAVRAPRAPLTPSPVPVAAGPTSPPSSPPPATTTPTVPSPATVLAPPPGSTSMAAIAAYIAQSAAVRPTIQGAINGVERCSIAPSTGLDILQQAVSTRQGIIQGLQTLPVDDVPHGPQMVTVLSQALGASITADQDYQSWMSDFANYGYQCGSDPTQDSQYSAGQAASQQASADKSAFVSLWNPQAQAYGQKTNTPNDL